MRCYVGFSSKTDPSRKLSDFTGMLVGAEAGEKTLRVGSLGAGRWIAESDFLPYHESRQLAVSLLGFVNEHGYTDRHSRMVIDARVVDGKSNVTARIDPMKVALAFDESAVERAFPGRLGSAFAQSVKEFHTLQTVLGRADMAGYTVMEGSERGIDFGKSIKGFVRMKYVGGAGYERKGVHVLALMEQLAATVREGYLNPRAYTPVERSEFTRIVDEAYTIRQRCKDLSTFRSSYPGIVLMADLRETSVLGVYPRMREMLVSLMEGCTLTPIEEGEKVRLNYDPDRGMMQIQDSQVRVRRVSRVDFHRCEVSGGRIHRCQLFESTCAAALLDCCYVGGDSQLSEATLVDCYLDEGTEVTESILDGQLNAVKCQVERSVIRKGRISKSAKIKDSEVFGAVTNE